MKRKPGWCNPKCHRVVMVLASYSPLSVTSPRAAPSLIALVPINRHRPGRICLMILAVKPVSGRPVRAMASWPRDGGCGRGAVLSIE